MKYPCNLIQDLLPLYYDGVCSEESKLIIKEHLAECSLCRELYEEMGNDNQIVISDLNTNIEYQKAASFHAVKKKLLKKQILIVIITLIFLSIVAFSFIGVLKNSVEIIPYKENLSVSMTDNSLIGRLQGNMANNTKIKRVEINTEDEVNTYLFFCLSGTKWDDLTTSNEVFSEYVICPAEKGAEQIDSVFYYTGDYTNIENMSENELQKIIDSSVLLWNK